MKTGNCSGFPPEWLLYTTADAIPKALTSSRTMMIELPSKVAKGVEDQLSQSSSSMRSSPAATASNHQNAGEKRLTQILAQACQPKRHWKRERQRQRNRLAAVPIEKENETFLSPSQLAQRWLFHPESVRRKLRRGELASVVIGRKRLIPLSEVRRLEAEGRIPARDLRSLESV